METDLQALQIILEKEHSFNPERRYIRIGHADMVPLLISFDKYFLSKSCHMSQDKKKQVRLKIVGYICGKQISSFYDLTYWQTVSISQYLFKLEEEENGKGQRFLEYVEGIA